MRLHGCCTGKAFLVVGHRDTASGLVPSSVALRVLAGACCPVLIVRGGLRQVRDRVRALVNIDESCDDLLSFAFASASRRGAGLVVVNVWDEPWVQERAEGGDPSGDIHMFGVDRARRLDRLVSPWRSEYPDVKVSRQVRIGMPGPVLAPMSAASDLLVVGARRHGCGTEGMHVGHVADAMLHWSRCPVAVVPVD